MGGLWSGSCPRPARIHQSNRPRPSILSIPGTFTYISPLPTHPTLHPHPSINCAQGPAKEAGTQAGVVEPETLTQACSSTYRLDELQ